jgi:hypothetical protein
LSLKELTDLFQKLGAQNPADWASSQVNENLPQLARFLFLREAWKRVVGDSDASWIKARMADDPAGPGGEIGSALKRVLGTGAGEDDLTVIVRTMQWRVLVGLCQLLDDPGRLENEVRDIAWRLFQVDDDDQPTAVLSGLHESVLETDPTGRAMRPR